MRVGVCLACVAALCALSVGASAEDRGALTAFAENDWFAGLAPGFTDRHYSAGQNLFYRRPEGRVAPWPRKALAALPGGEGEALYESWAIGNAFFTPEDLRLVEPDPDDRPYAGWLRGTYVLSRLGESRAIDSFTLDVGLVGPATQTDHIQEGLHDIIQQEAPRGWDAQLENEPTLQIGFERKAARRTMMLGRFEADVRPKVQTTLGNTFVQAGVGGEARIGFDLTDDYGPGRLGPANPYPGFSRRPPVGRSGYVFATVDGRYVERNMFISGNTFGGGVDTELELENWVADYRVGVTVASGRWNASFSHVLRTKEFEGQDGRQQFGQLTLTRRF